MFFKKTTNPKGITYLHIVESYRKNKKVCQRTICSLGKIEDGKLALLAKLISQHTDLWTAQKLAEKINIKSAYILGPLLILEKLFETLNLNDTLKKVSNNHEKISFDLRKIVFTLIASRFVEPGSKLKVFEHWQKKFYPEMLEPDLKLHTLYRALDLLAQHKEEIERNCFWHDRDLFHQKTDVILYDLTTLRFESVRSDLGQLRQFGYSKEKRNDCVQVILGLAVDKDGMPLGFEVYPGNTFEGKTLQDVIQKIKKRFRVNRFILVGDRGLFSNKNLKMLREKRGEFIIGMKLGVFKKRHKEFYNKRLFEKVNDDLYVYETEHEGERLLVTWSKKRAERDRKTREDILSKIKKKLSQRQVKAHHFVTNSNYKKYVSLSSDKRSPVLNERVIEEESRRDGFFGVVTNVRDMSSGELFYQYKCLWKVEDVFGELKGTLRARPMFHWTDKRITGHLVMCFMAYFCEAYITRYRKNKGAFLLNEEVSNSSFTAPNDKNMIK